MAKFNSDGNPIRNSGRDYLSKNVKKTDTITSLYEKGNDAKNNYEFVKGCKFCLSGQNDENSNPVDLSEVTKGYMKQIDELTEERDMFDVSFNYFKNQLRLKDISLNDCRRTVSGDGASHLIDLETLRKTHNDAINNITKERDDLKARNKEMEEELRKKDNLINTMSNDLMEEQVCCDSKTTKLENTENQLIQAENELDAAWDTMGEYSPVIVQ